MARDVEIDLLEQLAPRSRRSALNSRAPESWPGVGPVMEWLRSIGVDPDLAIGMTLQADAVGAPEVTLTFSMDRASASPARLRRFAADLITRANHMEQGDGAS